MRISCLHSPLRTLFFAAILYLFAPESAHAQSASATPIYLYASIPNGTATSSQVDAFSVDPSGVLTPVTGSPFLESREGGLVTVDPLNQFVFVLNALSDDISVLSIDPTGALTELTAAGSPFAAPTPSSGGAAPTGPTSMAAFKSPTANYLYVAYRNGPFPFTGAIVQFQIGTATQPLAPISTTVVEATPLAIVVSPQGYLYAALQSTNQSSGVGVFAIDSASGALNPESDAAPIHINEQTLTINSTGTLLFDGWGMATGRIEGSPILADGSAEPNPTSVPIVLQSQNSPPSAMLVDGTGQLLYVEERGQAAVYLIDPTTGALVAPPSSTQLPLTLSLGNTVADPIEPYLYTLTSGEVHVLRITDFTTGSLAELPGSPYIVGNGSGSNGLAMTNSAAPTVSGLAAGLTPTVLSFPDTPVTQPSAVELVHLNNNGSQPLDITTSAIAITGADQSDFSFTHNCPPQLASHAACIISVTFQPALPGPRQATLTVPDSIDNQSATLKGNGVAAQSGVTLLPPSLTFTTTQTGNASAPLSVILTNSGAATLHITSILTGGQNPGDFAIVASATPSGAPPPCALSAYAPNASCSITIVFSPLGAGARSASINIADDAPGTTQTVQLSGTGLGAPVPQPATAAATLAPKSLTFTAAFVGAQTAQQSITVTSSGASPLHISSVERNGPNASDFTLINDCSTTTAYLPPIQACSISVSFTPSALGTRIASILVSDDGANSPQSIALVGSTQSETLTIVPSPTALGVGLSQTVSAGETANFPLQLNSTFNGTVTFSSCTGAPPSAVCTVPAPLAVVANQPTSFAITVATVAASSSTNFLRQPRRLQPPLTLVIQIFLLILYTAFRRGTARRARPFRAVHQPPPTVPLSASATIAALLALSLFTISGCGGASTVATAPAVTPAPQSQSYTITISPSATTSDKLPVPNVQPIQLTLVVN